LDNDVQPCNTNVPCTQNKSCIFDLWAEWSTCIAPSKDPCDGFKTRKRGMTPKIGHGKTCDGDLEEAISCMPPSAVTTCVTPAPADCELGSWNDWGTCTLACGGGQRTRSRRQVAGSFQGKPCSGNMEVVKPCNTQVCSGTLDCSYSDWADWGGCQSCGGQRTRQRHVMNYPTGNGKPCEDSELEEAGSCPRNCNNLYCSWGSWREWGACSTKCGSGKRSRTRILGLVQKPPALAKSQLWSANNNMDEAELEDRVQELYRKSKSVEASRSGELVFAFSLGAFVLLAMMSIGPIHAGYRRWRHSTESTSQIMQNREVSMPEEGPLMTGCLSRTPPTVEMRLL